MTSLWLDSASATADAIAEYACVMASLLRSPEAVRAAAPNVSAKVSDAKLTAAQRSTARRAKVDFPAPGMPQTTKRRCLRIRETPSRCHRRGGGGLVLGVLEDKCWPTNLYHLSLVGYVLG